VYAGNVGMLGTSARVPRKMAQGRPEAAKEYVFLHYWFGQRFTHKCICSGIAESEAFVSIATVAMHDIMYILYMCTDTGVSGQLAAIASYEVSLMGRNSLHRFDVKGYPLLSIEYKSQWHILILLWSSRVDYTIW
jgi:hypothetical protein